MPSSPAATSGANSGHVSYVPGAQPHRGHVQVDEANPWPHATQIVTGLLPRCPHMPIILVCFGADEVEIALERIDGMKRLTPDSTWWHRVPHREITRSVAQREGGQPWTILASICTRGKARSASWPRAAS